MFIEIEYNRNCPVDIENREKFENFIKNLLIYKISIVIRIKNNFINAQLNPFNLSCIDLIETLPRLIGIIPTRNGFKLYLVNVYKNNRNMKDVLKAIDFGSNRSGNPKRLFLPIFKSIEENISRHYLQYVGMF